MLQSVDAKDIDLKFYGRSKSFKYLISDILAKEKGYEFCVNKKTFYIPFEGLHNVYNAAASIAVADNLDLSDEEIRKGLEQATLPKMRLEEEIIDSFVFINDSYNSNPDSFKGALDVLQKIAKNSKKAVIAGGMLELGDQSQEFHEKLGVQIYEAGVDVLITLGEEAKKIAKGAIDSGMDNLSVFHAEDHDQAAKMIYKNVPPASTILLKGSRKLKMERILRCFTTCCTR